MSQKRLLTRAEWISLGNDVKQCRELLFRIAQQIQTTTSKVEYRKVAALCNRLDSIKGGWDGIVCRQYPDWANATHVFYGDKYEPEA